MDLVFAGENKRFSEIIFHYPNDDFGDVAKTAALQVANGQALWWTGDQARTTWLDDDQFLAYPVGTTVDGQIMVQEYGLNNGNEPLPYSLTTSDINISDGSILMEVSRVVFDWKRISGNHNVEITTKDWPRGEVTLSETATFNGQTTETDYRATGRSIAFRFWGDEISTEFRMGLIRIATQTRGRRGGG